jgi:hypothetical protein
VHEPVGARRVLPADGLAQGQVQGRGGRNAQGRRPIDVLLAKGQEYTEPGRVCCERRCHPRLLRPALLCDPPCSATPACAGWQHLRVEGSVVQRRGIRVRDGLGLLRHRPRDEVSARKAMAGPALSVESIRPDVI